VTNETNSTITQMLEDMTFSDLLAYLFGSFVVGGGILFIYMITHPDKVEKWGSIFYKLFFFFNKRIERKAVSSDIQSRLNSFIRNFKVEDVLPYGLRFRWVTGEDFDSYVEEGDVIVIMDNHRNNARNFIKAIMAYTSQGLLPNVKDFLPSEILTATEITLQEKIIKEQRSDALKIFREEIIPQRINVNTEIAKYQKKFHDIERSGYFDTMFLNQLAQYGAKLQDFTDDIGKADLIGFIEFLENLANREPRDDTTQLSYDGKIFRPWVILIAFQYKLAKKGLEPYLRRVQEAITKQFQSIYIQIREPSFKYADTIIDRIKKETTATFRWQKNVSARDKEDRFSKAIMILFRV